MHPLARWLRLAAILPLIVAVGCRGPQRRSVEVDGPAPGPGQSLAVDVTNFNGSVRLYVDDDLEAPRVRARLRAPAGTRLSDKRALKESVWIGAEIAEQEGGLVLRVLSRPDEDLEASDQVRVSLRIRVPECDGVLVRNTGGRVFLRQVRGAIQVDNGFAGTEGGPIVMHTDRPLEAPVALTTTEGDVHLQVAPDTAGKFELIADDGRTTVRAHAGDLTHVEAEPGRWVGVLNGGSNPILLRTSSGDASLLVIETAASHQPRR